MCTSNNQRTSYSEDEFLLLFWCHFLILKYIKWNTVQSVWKAPFGKGTFVNRLLLKVLAFASILSFLLILFSPVFSPPHSLFSDELLLGGLCSVNELFSFGFLSSYLFSWSLVLLKVEVSNFFFFFFF